MAYCSRCRVSHKYGFHIRPLKSRYTRPRYTKPAWHEAGWRARLPGELQPAGSPLGVGKGKRTLGGVVYS